MPDGPAGPSSALPSPGKVVDRDRKSMLLILAVVRDQIGEKSVRNRRPEITR